jgi:hypothetical protein
MIDIRSPRSTGSEVAAQESIKRGQVVAIDSLLADEKLSSL